MTNHEQQGQQIIGLNTENVEINEGLIRFDIIFYVRLPSEDSKDAGLTQIIINVEAQKDEPTSYEILNSCDILCESPGIIPKGAGFC